MKRSIRLTRSTDFQRVRRFGRSCAHPLLVLVVLPNQGSVSRFGVAAGRTIGNAVRRNRAKRRLREALRLNQNNISPGWDILLIARRPIAQASFQQLQDALVALLQRAKLWRDNDDR
ncbi:ribonuclease P protein component [Chloroflexota bacterium]